MKKNNVRSDLEWFETIRECRSSGLSVFFASSFWKKLQTKMENVASPKWRKLQALSDRRVLPSETCSIHC